ncbi:MAG: hypothetical protein Q7U04_13135, partial [Bacteriovorax sp.]|nr:hypothetical protein [Bacteriovorax sp.]
MHFKKRKIPSKVFIIFEAPVRGELFSTARLEKYAEELAQNHVLAAGNYRGVNLSIRVAENENVLLKSFQEIIKTVRNEKSITQAAEWFIDNFYIIEDQLKDIREHLPPEFYKELPKLASGEHVGLPRVYAIAWGFVAHTDSLFEPEILKLVLKAYQKKQVLTMGELWAISITLRIVMVENLRRLSARIVGSQKARIEADRIADEILGLTVETKRSNKEIIKSLSLLPMHIGFVVQLVQRLRFQEGSVVDILNWLEDRLQKEGNVIDEMILEEQTNQTAANVTVRNIINSMRLMSSLDWRDFFEEVSLVDEKLHEHPLYSQMDFITRDTYRHSLEELARGSKISEIKVASALIEKSKIDKKNDLGFYLISSGRYQFEKEINFKLKLQTRFLRWYVSHREILY